MEDGGKKSSNNRIVVIVAALAVLFVVVIFVFPLAMALGVSSMASQNEVESFLPEVDYTYDKDVVVKSTTNASGKWAFLIFSGSDVPEITELTAYSAQGEKTWKEEFQIGKLYFTDMPTNGGTVYLVGTFDDGRKLVLADTSRR